jgi:hypothetical protein
MTFNLPPPPNFRGIHPDRPVRRYERHLPHWRQHGATYFVTFNLADAIPANSVRQLESMRRAWEHKHPPPLVIISSCITAHPADFQRPTGQHHPPQTPRTEKARISNPGFSNKRLELGYASF